MHPDFFVQPCPRPGVAIVVVVVLAARASVQRVLGLVDRLLNEHSLSGIFGYSRNTRFFDRYLRLA